MVAPGGNANRGGNGKAPLTMILPRLVCFIGGMASKVALHLFERITRSYGSLTGPFGFVIFDSAKELDPSRLNGMEARFVYMRPISLNRLRDLTPPPRFSLVHLQNLDTCVDEGSPGAGSKPNVGYCFAMVHLPALLGVLAKMVGTLVHPRLEARTNEDVRFGGRRVDLTRLHVDLFAGHGGTSSMGIFAICECLREWLSRQDRPFHISGRFLLASGHVSLPQSIQPILHRNMAIQMSYMDAVQSGSPTVTRQMALLTDGAIHGNSGRLFEETVLYGQCAGQCLGAEDFTRTVADSYFHELSGMAGKLRFDDIGDGADIMLGGDSGQKLRLFADEVGHVDLVTGGIVFAEVSHWDGGLIQGSVLERIRTKNGSLGADLVNQRQDRRGYGINQVSVRNGDLMSHITGDRIKEIKVENGDATVYVTVTSDAVTLGRYEAFDRLSVRGGDLLGAYVHLEPGALMKRLEVKEARRTGGNVTGPVHITANLGRAFVSNDVVVNSWEIAENLGELKVKGLVSSAAGVSSIRTGGGIRKVELGSIQDVDILAGISSVVDRKATNAADFVNLVAIERFRIKGLPGPRPRPRFMINSFVSASTFGKFNLLNSDFPTSGLYVLSQGGAEIDRIVHKDTENKSDNFVYPPKPNQVFGGPAGFINLVV